MTSVFYDITRSGQTIDYGVMGQRLGRLRKEYTEYNSSVDDNERISLDIDALEEVYRSILENVGFEK